MAFNSQNVKALFKGNFPSYFFVKKDKIFQERREKVKKLYKMKGMM